VMIASYRARRRPHYVNVLLSCQLCEREWLDNEPACVAGWSESFSDCLRKHRCVLRSLTRSRRNYSAIYYGIIPSYLVVFRRAAPRNIENRGHASDCGERVRIKGEHLRERIRTKRSQARKSH
jgi:hypothetical protein